MLRAYFAPSEVHWLVFLDFELETTLHARPGLKNLAVEIKSTEKITEDHVRSFSRIAKDIPNTKAICPSNDKRAKIINGVECVFWQDFISEL